jgi:uncharacterized protein
VEKIYHVLVHRDSHEKPVAERVSDETELLRLENTKVKSAIRTDFILSIEIVMIALGTVIESSLMLQIMVVSLIAIFATIGVYGLVALVVRMDDVGFFLIDKAKQTQGTVSKIISWLGSFLVASLPWVIRSLGIIGTIAMLLVGGGMFTHNIEYVHHALLFMPTFLANFVVGFVVGAVLVGAMMLVPKKAD